MKRLADDGAPCSRCNAPEGEVCSFWCENYDAATKLKQPKEVRDLTLAQLQEYVTKAALGSLQHSKLTSDEAAAHAADIGRNVAQMCVFIDEE